MKKISKNMLFNIFLVSFLFGIFLNNYFLNYKVTFIILVFISIFLLNLIIYIRNYKKYLIYLFILIISFIFGIFVSQNNLNEINDNNNFIEIYDSNFQSNIKLEIIDTYKIKDYDNEYIAKLILVNNEILDSKKEILGLVKIAKNYNIKKGDIIESKAKIEKIRNFNDFDYKHFLLSKNIYFKSYLPFIENVGNNKRNIILEKIDILREKSLKIIYEIYPKNEAIFLAGILLGARESLPQDLKDNFNNSGLTHFIAVSGFNITILILFFSFIFKFLPIVLRTILITIVIILFTFLVGDTAPVIRASLMGLIAYYVMVSGRKGSIFTILMLTAFIMALFSPLILNYDVSFSLSFLAVFGIVYTQDFWKKVFKFMPETLAIKEAFMLTMAALSFTLPIMLFNFGQVSILAPFANVAITWTIPIAMLLGFISIIAYVINPIFGYIIGYLDWVFLKWDMLVVNFFGTKEFSVLKYDFGENATYIQIIYFIILIFLVLFFRGRKKSVIEEEFGSFGK